ncbi:hypothetical protein CDEST_06742 [Colletotrichum destructivum]|uniref:Uncharacterized protein n=1 Tax=Colletotrichum destructivum TaxID=34406 RepID=A0AAX4IG03_9PEZI|nr:hypothetical protein CDEST_06742 [Colletotrichum destructivum]
MLRANRQPVPCDWRIDHDASVGITASASLMRHLAKDTQVRCQLALLRSTAVTVYAGFTLWKDHDNSIRRSFPDVLDFPDTYATWT